jgi:hypothetical protein
MNLRTLTERHVTTFQKQLINLIYQPTWTILVKLSEINMIPLIFLNKTQKFYHMVKYLWWPIKTMREKKNVLAQYNILFPQLILFPQERYFVPSIYYFVLDQISLDLCALYI